MAMKILNPYSVAVFDERFSTVEDDRVYENVVVYVRESDGTAATLYTDRRGTTAKANPFVIDSTYKADTFFSDQTALNIAVYDYGNADDEDHAQRFGRWGFYPGVTPTSGQKSLVLPRQQAVRWVKIPFLATGTDASDTPNTWDNAEANAVIVNGSEVNISMPKGFIVNDVFVEVRTADSGETLDCGLLSSVSGDADGFVAAASLTSTGIIRPGGTKSLGSNADYWSASTRGAYLATFTAGADTSAASIGTYQEIEYICNGTALLVSLTGSAGIDTAEGDVWLVGYMLPSPAYMA